MNNNLSIEEMDKQFWKALENYKEQKSKELKDGKIQALKQELRSLRAHIITCHLNNTCNEDGLRMHEAQSEVLIDVLGLGTYRAPENAYSYPTEISSANLYNFKVACPIIFESEPADLDTFKKKIIGIINKGMSFEEVKNGKKSQILTSILIFVAERPQKAFFRKFRAEAYAKEKQCMLSEYVIMPIGSQTMIIGNPPLSKDQETSIFRDLIDDASSASPFDDMGQIGDLASEILKKEKPNWPVGKNTEPTQ